MKSLDRKKSAKEKAVNQKHTERGPAAIDPRIIQAALIGVDEPVGALAGRK